MSKKEISIVFKAQDYQEFSNVKCIKNGVQVTTDDTKEEILYKVLSNIDKDMFVNKGERSNNNKYFSNYNDKWYIGGIVGVISTVLECYIDDNNNISFESSEKNCKINVRIEIRSRLDNNENKPYFLSAMLMNYCGLKSNNNLVPSKVDNIFDYMLLFWFKKQFTEAYQKGYFRKYKRFEKNDDRLRGSIDISRHIKLNAGQNNGKIAYSYRENTVNNDFNHLLIAAYECLKRKFPDLINGILDNDYEIKSAISTLKMLIGFTDYNSSVLIAKNSRVIAHPYYTEYETLRRTCVMILRDEGLTIYDGDNDDTQSILFYLPDLWEIYLENVFNEHLNNDIKLWSQQEINIFSRTQDFNQSTYPDYIFTDKEGSPFMILDAKFKPKWREVDQEGKRYNVFDDYNKCIRDMNSLNVHATGAFYPYNPNDENDKPNYAPFNISAFNPFDHFYTFGVQVPKSTDEQTYDDWNSAFEDNVNTQFGVIVGAIKNEKERQENINANTFDIKQLIPNKMLTVPH